MYVLTSAKLNAMGHRWLAALAAYTFSLQYKPGKHNTDVDVLSRYPTNPAVFASWTEIPQSGDKAICQLASSSGSDESVRLVDHLGVSPDGISSAYSCPISLEMCHMEQLTHEDLKISQEQDPVIGVVKQDIEVGKMLTLRKSSDPVLTVLQQQGPKLVIRNQLLYRVSKSSCGKERVQLVLPAKYHWTILKSLHDDSVLIRNLACTGKHKLQNRWNFLPYVVIEKFKDLPVYKLRPESGMDRIRTLHRDHLLPIGDKVRFSKPGDSNQLVQPPVMRAQTVKRRQRKQNKDSVDQIDCGSQELSRSEDDDLCYYRPARIRYQRPTSPPRALEPETVPLEGVPELTQECAGREDPTENDP